MDKKLFADLKESLNEAIQHASGKLDLRTTTLPRPPKAMERAEIAALRKKKK
jgi:DNA-binding transcriptional regulator YiaG